VNILTNIQKPPMEVNFCDEQEKDENLITVRLQLTQQTKCLIAIHLGNMEVDKRLFFHLLEVTI